MARQAAGFSIAQLEQVLQQRRSELGRLNRERSELQRKLDGLDRQIAKINGSLRGRRGGGGRRQNKLSLVEAMESVMQGSGKPMRVGEILDAVEARGYRSSSDNFRGIVNQTLIKEKKRFAAVSRGLYQIKGTPAPARGSKKEASGNE